MMPRVLYQFPQSAGKPFQPSNGTEGMIWMESFCDQCKNKHPDPDKEPQCSLIMNSMVFSPGDENYPSEWRYDHEGWPICTDFVKWDWDKDDDGNWNDPPIEPDPDPNQLLLFPIWEGMAFSEGISANKYAVFETSELG